MAALNYHPKWPRTSIPMLFSNWLYQRFRLQRHLPFFSTNDESPDSLTHIIIRAFSRLTNAAILNEVCLMAHEAMLCGEVPTGGGGTLNFTLCVSRILHSVIAITFGAAKLYEMRCKRFMRIRGLSCIFPVPEIQKTAEFYVSTLGFRAVPYLECKEPHICLYRDDAEIILLQAKTDSIMPNRMLYGYGYNAYLYVENQECLGKLQ